jgi:drug/metabolite transporter, DME family
VGAAGLSRSGLGLAAVAAGAALFALAGAVASRLFDAGIAPAALAEARAAIAFAGLALVPAARRPPPRRPRPGLLVALGVAIMLVTLAYYVAISRLPVAVAIVLQYTGPAMVVAWVAAVTRRRPRPEILASLVAAVVGVVLVSELPVEGLSGVDLIGLGAGFASAVLFATYTLLSEAAQATYGSVGMLLRGFAVATLLWVVLQAPQGWPREVFRAEHLPEVAFVGVGGTLCSFLLYVWGVARIRSERASIAATLEPVLAALVAWAWLGQSLSAWQIAGGALVVGAVIGLQLGNRAALHTGS